MVHVGKLQRHYYHRACGLQLFDLVLHRIITLLDKPPFDEFVKGALVSVRAWGEGESARLMFGEGRELPREKGGFY